MNIFIVGGKDENSKNIKICERFNFYNTEKICEKIAELNIPRNKLALLPD